MKIKPILIIVILSASFIPLESDAGCGRDDHFLGAPAGKKMMSSFDVTFFPTFAFSSTSGTSGCRNWDLVQMETEQAQWLLGQWSQMLEDVARGQQNHTSAFSSLLGCPSQAQDIKLSLLNNYHTWSLVHAPNDLNEARELLQQLSLSLSQNSKIQKICFSDEF